MALIKCPNCGKEISSMAKACPQCGCPVEYYVQEKTKCPECGMENDPSAKICAKCACPMDVALNKVEELPRDNENHLSSTPPENINPNDVDYDKIFRFGGDEFDECKMVGTQFELENATQINFPQPLRPGNPYLICVECLVNTENQYLLCYNWDVELAQLELLGVAGVPNDEYGFGVPFKGAIITIDGTETIKLADVVGENNFLMNREQVFKCCNAHSIKFKLFRKNGITFTIEGTEESTQLMIDAFRGMYHYIEDKTMYIDSLYRLQRWYEKFEAESKEKERQQERKKNAEESSKKTKKTIGIILIIIGSIMFLIPIIVLIANPYYDGDNGEAVWMIFGMILTIVGAVMWGVSRGEKVEDILTTIGNNLNS